MMLKTDVEDEIVSIVADQFGLTCNDVSRETNINKDLNGDSLDAVEIVIEIEDEFDFAIADEDVEHMTTVGQMVDYVGKKLKESGRLLQ